MTEVPRNAVTEKEGSLLAFWESLRRGRAMPKRSDFLAEDLFPWMGYLHLLVPENGGRTFRYTVFATRTLLEKDRDLTGRLISDWEPRRAQRAFELYSAVAMSGRPIYCSMPERHDLDWISYSRLCLPFGEPGNVSHILSMLTRHKAPLSYRCNPSVIAETSGTDP